MTEKSGNCDAEEFTFSVNGNCLAATKIWSRPRTPVRVAAFHGFGRTANRARIRYLLDPIANDGISSLCFDFSGNGESSGVFEDTTLRMREAECEDALNLLDRRSPLAIIGTSMGAHLAVLASEAHDPKCLILFSPAAYSDIVRDCRFDSSFAERPDRFAGAKDATGSSFCRALSRFRGDLLVIAGTGDTVVPAETAALYSSAAPLARSNRTIHLEGCDHFVHPWLIQNDTQRARVMEAILSMLKMADAS